MGKDATSLSELGLYGLIERVRKQYSNNNPSTLIGIGDDSSLIKGEGKQLISSVLFLEGIDFDLVYNPLQHLGFKVVVSAVSDILAMNGQPNHITVNLGISNKIDLEKVDLLMSGIKAACETYQLDLIGFKPSASLTGLTISAVAFGAGINETVLQRNGSKPTDLLCVTGNLGGALMGLHLLEREKRVLKSSGVKTPQLGEHEYVLQRQLKPLARIDVLSLFKELGIVPTSMTCIKEGLATSLLLLSQSSGVGCRIYENKIPIDQNTMKAAKELGFNPTLAALNGGEEYEMLFSVPLDDYEKRKDQWPDDFSIVGYVTEEEKGCRMIPVGDQGEEVDIKAQGWGTKG